LASEDAAIARGHWHRSSRSLPARLGANGRRLSVFIDGQPDPAVTGELAEVSVSDRVGRIPRRIGFADGSLFETPDNDAVDAYLSTHRANRTGFVHGLEKFHPRLIGFALAVFLLAGLIYRFAVPALVEVAIWVTPPVATEMMAAGTLSSLDQAVFSPGKLPEAEQASLKSKFEALAVHAKRGPAGYRLNFRSGGFIGPNAFALPDGTLVITDELIEMAEGDSEMLLGVLAHEIGHVDHDHSLRQLYRAAGTAALIMLIAGDIGSAGEDILTNGAALVSLSYSRDAESEADRASVELMAKAGHDPTAVGRFFAVLERKLGDKRETSMFSTHPGTPERRKAIDDYATLLKERHQAK
jgi:Zn-dependent protease with chaperone function